MFYEFMNSKFNFYFIFLSCHSLFCSREFSLSSSSLVCIYGCMHSMEDILEENNLITLSNG